MLTVNRNEIKYMINKQERLVIEKRLKLLCNEDSNADENGEYLVSSLYFDDYRDSALEDKLAGVTKRKKYRIRIYNGQDDLIKLERKAKNANACIKNSVNLTREEYELIIKEDYEFMRDSTNPILKDFYTLAKTRQLRPKVIVNYKRQSFIYPYGNVRITMDSQLHGSYGQCDLFGDNALIPITETHETILEVKFTGYLPGMIKDAIQHGRGNMEAISKYTACRMLG